MCVCVRAHMSVPSFNPEIHLKVFGTMYAALTFRDSPMVAQALSLISMAPSGCNAKTGGLMGRSGQEL